MTGGARAPSSPFGTFRFRRAKKMTKMMAPYPNRVPFEYYDDGKIDRLQSHPSGVGN